MYNVHGHMGHNWCIGHRGSHDRGEERDISTLCAFVLLSSNHIKCYRNIKIQLKETN